MLAMRSRDVLPTTRVTKGRNLDKTTVATPPRETQEDDTMIGTERDTDRRITTEAAVLLQNMEGHQVARLYWRDYRQK